MVPRTVLIVDDDRDVVFLISSYLQTHAGMRVLHSFDGHEAIRIAENEHPDIILLDVMMPELDGLAVCAMLQGNSETATIPVVILTARSDVETAVESFRRGAENYIIKPIEPVRLLQKLIETLDRCEERRRLQDEP